MPRNDTIHGYVCETCGRFGATTEAFNDECAPGWTHGRLIRVTTAVVTVDALLSDEAINAARIGSGIRDRMTAFNARSTIEAAIAAALPGGEP